MTALSQIFAVVDERLLAVVEPDDGSYERMPSGDPDTFPALEVHDSGDNPVQFESGTTHTELHLELIGFVEGDGGASTHDAMLELHAKAIFALCGDDATLGGLVENVEAGDRRAVKAMLASKDRVGFSADIVITLTTRRGDPRDLA